MASSNQQPSFKTNVNRMKTKRWVEAKSYTYDGDDWGDADEYDEYDGYDDPAPAPAPAASSSRQPSSGYPHDSRQQPAPFPGAPPQPAYMHQQPRSGSPGRPPYAQDPRDRSGSFDRGDERRNFSGPPAPGSPTVAPLRTAYGSAPRNQSPMGRGQPRAPVSPQYGQPGFPGGRPSMDPQIRGPPGQLPPPEAPFASAENSGRTWSMGSRGSQGSHGSIALAQRRDYPSGPVQGQQPQNQARPPRKSSLGQSGAPSPALMQNMARPSVSVDPQASREPSGSASAPLGPESPTAKIIRPADIYKRVAEEKERERMSQESGRPSMSDIMIEKESTPAAPSGHEGASTSLRPRKHTLDTVAERKSEYGQDGLLGQGAQPSGQLPPSVLANMTEEQYKRFSTSPQLPDFGSGFGDDDWLSGFGSEQAKQAAATQQKAHTDPVAREADVGQTAAGLGLSHKPSDGFRSVVHQAFDEPVRTNTPGGSEVGRSDTTSTNAISPIVGRNSGKEQEIKGKGGELRAVNMGAIAEEGNIGVPFEGGAERIPGQIDGKAQPSDELPPPGFVPGHRRNTSVPSPGNSPARQPKLEVRNVPQDEEGAEFAAATPNEERESRRRAASAAKATQIQSVVETLAQQARDRPLSQTSPTRADSPTKGRVRDLVDKAESASSSRRGSESSQTGGLRPSQERADSFRPQLPGGWNSYVTNPMSPSPDRGVSPLPEGTSSPNLGTSAEVRPSSLPGAAVNPTLLGHGGTSPSDNPTSPNMAKEGIDIEPTTRKRSLVQGEATDSIDPVRDPLAAAKAAGAALASAVTTTTGLGNGSQKEPTHDQYGTARGQHVYEKGGTTMYPESSRPMMPPSQDSAATSIMPTPRALSPQRTAEAPLEDDIPAVAPLRQRGPGAPGSPVVGMSGPVQGAFASGQPMSPLGSVSRDASMDEHERHMQDIVRQLTPNPPTSEPATSQPPTPTPPSQLYSTPGQTVQQAPTSTAPALQPARQAKPKKTLKHKFSWEADSGDDEEDEEEPASSTGQPNPPTQFTPTPSGAGPIIAPTQTITTVKSEPVSELDSTPSTFQHSFMSPATPAARVEPATVELPTLRMSSDAEDSRQISELSVTASPQTDRPSVDDDQLKSPPPPAVPLKNDVSPMSPSDDSRSVEHQQFQPPSQGARQRGQTLTGSQVQVPAFREILAMKSPDERLRVYRNTQDTFANMNTGLTNWIQTMGEKHPEHRPLLQTAGNFSAPTPGLPAAPRPQPGASTSTGSGSGFSGLRKAGAVAAPSMGDAGAALKSAGRDTKKLAKGLFAKGRSKFGRDKGSSKLAPFSSPPQKYQPYRPGVAAPPAQNQGQSLSDRPNLMVSQSVARAVPTKPSQDSAVRAIPVPNPPPVPAPGAAPIAARHTANQKSLPDIPMESPAASVAPRPSDVSGLTHTSVDEDRMGEILIGFPAPESPPKPKPALRQRLTIHQKDIKPFEVSFPSELLDSDAYKESGDDLIPPVPPLTDHGKPGTPKEEEAIPEQTTPRQTKFPKRTQSLSAGRTLDPGVEVFNTTPSWLNWDPANSPASSDFFGLSSPSNKSTKSSPMDVRSKRASLQLPVRSPENKKDPAGQHIHEEDEVVESLRPTPGTEDRPFSFINFGERPDTDFSLNEVAYRAPSRQSSVITESTGEYNPSAASTREESLHHEVSRDEEFDVRDQKPLPEIPNTPSEAFRMNAGSGQYATMPPRAAPKMSLFPQSTSRPGTREREPDNYHGDFGPPRLQNKPPEQSATMPAGGGKPQKHRRNFSGANLLQRALTAGINTLESSPKRDKNVVKAEKTDKKRRRFSNLNILGKPKPVKRVPIDDITPPGTSRPNVPTGGVGDLATTAQPMGHLPKQAMQRPNIPDPIHVAPIEGYYSPEGDATQSPALLSSPIPSTHIASQLNDGTIRTVTRTSTSPAVPFHHSPSPGQKNGQVFPPPSASPNQASAFNESNNALRQAFQQQKQPQHSSPTQPTSHPPPASNPPSTKLPQVPHVAQTLQREATLRHAPDSPQRPIDPEQLNPLDGFGGSGASGFLPTDLPIDRRSLDAFPRPPSKSSNASASGLSPNSRSPGSGAMHSPSPSMSATRRSRGPSLSVDTNLANNVSEGRRSRTSQASQASRPSNVGLSAGAGDGTGATSSQKNSNNPSTSNLPLADQINTAIPSRAPGSTTIPQDQQDHSDDELPSGLSALHQSLSQHQHQQQPPRGLGLSMSASTNPPTDSAQTDLTLDSARKVAILPAALRQMRQREIELGGETRLNSPLAAGASAGVDAMPMPRLDVVAVAEREKEVEKEKGKEKEVVAEGKGFAEEKQVVVGAAPAHGGPTGHLKVQRADTGMKAQGGSGEGEGKEKGTSDEEEKEEKIVMSATSFPGQEWNPYEEWM